MEELAVIFMTIQIIFLQAECVASLFNMRNKSVQTGMGADAEQHMPGEYTARGYTAREYTARGYTARGYTAGEYTAGEYTANELLPYVMRDLCVRSLSQVPGQSRFSEETFQIHHNFGS